MSQDPLPAPSTPENPPPSSNRRLTGGCLMMLVVAGWIVALGLWMAWHLYGQVREIRTFTDPTAQAISPLAPTGAQKSELQGRLTAFATAIGAKQAATLTLSVDDLNHLLAAQEPVNRLQDIARVEAITDVIRVKVALALNGIPFTGERLYLNGFISVRPDLKKDLGPVLLTRAIEVPGRTLTEGFTKTYLEANHLDSLALDEVRKDESLKPLLGKITTLRCEPGQVIAEYVP
jgi:hypothetical protein